LFDCAPRNRFYFGRYVMATGRRQASDDIYERVCLLLIGSQNDTDINVTGGSEADRFESEIRHLAGNIR